MTIVTKGFTELAKKLEGNGLNQRLFTALRNSATAVLIAAQNNAPVGATSNLKRSLSMKLDQGKLQGTVGFDKPGSDYARFVEFGTSPHWAPIAALMRWATQRGLNPWAVQASIAKKGTKAHPFFLQALSRNADFIKTQFKKALHV